MAELGVELVCTRDGCLGPVGEGLRHARGQHTREELEAACEVLNGKAPAHADDAPVHVRPRVCERVDALGVACEGLLLARVYET